jgi:hypothetical protein
MSIKLKLREIYRSAPDGDAWYLARDTDSGNVFVRHLPNKSSGGQSADFALGAFLVGMQESPEKRELLRLIGTLV